MPISGVAGFKQDAPTTTEKGHLRTHELQMELIYCSSVSGPSSRLDLRSDKTGVPIRTDSYSVTTTVPGTGSSITSIIVSSTGTSTTRLSAFLAAVFGDCFFLVADFGVVLPARSLDFAFLDVVCFAAFLRAGLALALPRFELFLRAATRFFALAIAVPCEVCYPQANPTMYVISAIASTKVPNQMIPFTREPS